MHIADRDQRLPDLMGEWQAAMSQRTGRVCSTWCNHFLGQTIFYTSDPRNIQALLATSFADYDLGVSRANNLAATLGHDIFTQDGRDWERSRALLRPNFARDQVSDLELEERHVRAMFRAIGPVNAGGWTPELDMQRLFFRLTIDSATEFLFGESVDSQNLGAAGEGESTFSRHFDSAQKHLAQRLRLGDWYWLHNPADFRRDNGVVQDFLQPYVDRAIREADAEAAAEKTPAETAQYAPERERYVFMKALARQTRDPHEIRSQLLNILLAGRDTTASLLSWTVHQLLRHPDVFTSLRAAVIAEFGPASNSRPITFAGLKACAPLQHVLAETLRLWPVVPFNVRRSNKPTTLPRGGGPHGDAPVFVPAGTDVRYSAYTTQRRTDLWGPDAAHFRPDRFRERRPAGSAWNYLPFNGGPRICIGQQFALTEAAYVVVRLLQRFDVWEPGVDELVGRVRSNVSLTNCPGKPVRLRLHEAQE